MGHTLLRQSTTPADYASLLRQSTLVGGVALRDGLEEADWDSFIDERRVLDGGGAGGGVWGELLSDFLVEPAAVEVRGREDRRGAEDARASAGA